MNIEIRWMIRRDMPEVLAIEKASFEFSWSEEDFIRCLRQKNCIGMVAEVAPPCRRGGIDEHGPIIGFFIQELHRNRLHVLDFAVHPDYRRQGIGRAMVNKLVSKLSHERRNKIVLEVRETNLQAQFFFKEMGFKAISLLRDFYEDTSEDGYLMQYRYHADVPQKVRVAT